MIREDFNLRAHSDDGEIPCTVLQNEENNASTNLVVVPSVFGVDDTFLLHCQRFLDSGFRVYALDSFWRTEPGPLIANEAGIQKAMARMGALNDQDCDCDVSALLDHVRAAHTEQRIIGLGICFGGRPVFRAAIDAKLDGVAAWHGVRIGELASELTKLPCPASLQFGAIDAWTPAEDISAIKQATSNLNGVDIQVHADCDHGFTHLGRAPVFNQAAYDKSYASLLKL
ncbi:MAG: dienelactone hydrolase family protein [Pseudomonadales bacterium]